MDLGCNFFDTAWAYGGGKSDELLGEIMQRNKGRRLYAASKIPPANDRWPALPEYKYSDVFSAEHVLKYADLIRKAVLGSLQPAESMKTEATGPAAGGQHAR